MSRAEYFRQWRAKRGARTGQVGRRVSSPCGTASAYKRHIRRKETTCEQCRTAWREYKRERAKPLTQPAAGIKVNNNPTSPTEGTL